MNTGGRKKRQQPVALFSFKQIQNARNYVTCNVDNVPCLVLLPVQSIVDLLILKLLYQAFSDFLWVCYLLFLYFLIGRFAAFYYALV